MEERIISVGDWVRFYQNNRFVIARVEYPPTRNSWERHRRVQTDHGEVSEASILEVRPPVDELGRR